MEAPFSVGYSEFIIKNFREIPNEDFRKILFHLANEFKDIKKRGSMIEFLMTIFRYGIELNFLIFLNDLKNEYLFHFFHD
jgi:hypothetical protein